GLIDEKIARREKRERRLMRAAIETWRVSDRHGVAHTPSISVLQQLSDSKAEIVLVNLEDLWEETRPQNIPATGAERPNWRRRVRPSLEQIRKMGALAEELSNVFAQRSRSISV